MPRTQPPPWVRWLGEDVSLQCDAARSRLDQLEAGLLGGSPLHEVVIEITRIRNELGRLRDSARSLQNGPSITELVDWAMDDRTFLVLLDDRRQE